MFTLIRPAFMLLASFSLLTGLLYPALVTGIANIAFPRQAQGSLLMEGKKVVGSELIGQPFTAPGYFWSRPSATGPFPYNAAASSGSNLGPLHPGLKDAVAARVAKLQEGEPTPHQRVPIDLVTTSGSGLDPHISPAAAYYQVHRVASARGLAESVVHELVAGSIEGRTMGVLGEPRVNVLALNLKLDQLSTKPGA